jgi:hypothetical protein
MSAPPTPEASASSTNSHVDRSVARDTLIDDRYRIEKTLGRGGMGEVLAVVEEATGKRLALKRLLPGAKPKHALLLAREFHTLHGLAHPNVVHAFDYGVSGGTPYYTMKLLAGDDVEGTAPLAWQEVVPILRDVASALSLIHARHLVHRDVSANNVWRTPDGVVKLIDFGALTNFGDASDIAGTPPYLAPEALRSHVLDQRTDLFSLGVLAYYLLTGRHAFSARAFTELEQHWVEGHASLSARLTQLARADLPPAPEALEQLVDALLALEPQSRPASAAEVLDRLDEILPDRERSVPAAVQGVLLSKAFVGREAELKRVAGLLKRMSARMQASAALIGEEGAGRSRLLAQIALEARVAGASVVLLSGDGDKTPLSSATRATLKALETLPSLARSCAAPHARVLGHLSPELCRVLSVDPAQLETFPDAGGEARLRLSGALHAFWCALTSKQPVAVLLDDFEAMDEASAGLFATLSRTAGETQLLVVAAVRTEDGATIPELAQALVEKALPIPVAPLLLDECTAMLRSMFGDAEHLGRTAQHLADKSEGNPGRLMELCEHSVRSGAMRWIDGAWVLPQEITTLALPDSRKDLIEASLARLGPEARSLASALSVIEGVFSLELCAALSPLPQQAMFAALNELAVAGVVLASGGAYRFRNEAMRVALSAALTPEQAQRAHGAAGDALLRSEQLNHVLRLTAGLHLLRAQRAREGAEVVIKATAAAAVELPEPNAELSKRLEQALPFLRAQKLNQYELQAPLCVLAWCGYFAGRRFGFVYGDEALACAQEVCGMNRARKLSRWFGKKLGLYLALIAAAILFRRARRKSPLVPDMKLGMRLLMLASGSLCGMYTLCIARDKVAAQRGPTRAARGAGAPPPRADGALVSQHRLSRADSTLRSHRQALEEDAQRPGGAVPDQHELSRQCRQQAHEQRDPRVTRRDPRPARARRGRGGRRAGVQRAGSAADVAPIAQRRSPRPPRGLDRRADERRFQLLHGDRGKRRGRTRGSQRNLVRRKDLASVHAGLGRKRRRSRGRCHRALQPAHPDSARPVASVGDPPQGKPDRLVHPATRVAPRARALRAGESA